MPKIQKADVAQLVEHLIENQSVTGSIPVFGTNSREFKSHLYAGSSGEPEGLISLTERGSNPRPASSNITSFSGTARVLANGW